MTTRIPRRLLATVLALLGTSAFAEQTVTFHVPVKLLNMYSDVKTFAVGCNLRNTANPLASYAFGRTDINISQKYNAIVAVPVKVPDSVASQVNSWSCEITLFNSGAGMGCTPAVNAPVNACKAKAGSELVTKVQGSL
jgi:hypothetical protein